MPSSHRTSPVCIEPSLWNNTFQQDEKQRNLSNCETRYDQYIEDQRENQYQQMRAPGQPSCRRRQIQQLPALLVLAIFLEGYSYDILSPRFKALLSYSQTINLVFQQEIDKRYLCDCNLMRAATSLPSRALSTATSYGTNRISFSAQIV